jgi:hypothetical protein
VRLFEQLGPQGSLVTGFVEDPGDRLASVCGDDRRDPIADELVVGETLANGPTARNQP